MTLLHRERGYNQDWQKQKYQTTRKSVCFNLRSTTLGVSTILWVSFYRYISWINRVLFLTLYEICKLQLIPSFQISVNAFSLRSWKINLELCSFLATRKSKMAIWTQQQLCHCFNLNNIHSIRQQGTNRLLDNKSTYLLKLARIIFAQQSWKKLQTVQSCLFVYNGFLTLSSAPRYYQKLGY